MAEHPLPTLAIALARGLQGPYTPIAAWLQILPEGLHLGEVHLVERDGHLPNGVIAAETVVVQDLEVEDPLHHFLIGKTWGRQINKVIRIITRTRKEIRMEGREIRREGGKRG